MTFSDFTTDALPLIISTATCLRSGGGKTIKLRYKRFRKHATVHIPAFDPHASAVFSKCKSLLLDTSSIKSHRIGRHCVHNKTKERKITKYNKQRFEAAFEYNAWGY